jgi:nicotinamide mononucleotide transporter
MTAGGALEATAAAVASIPPAEWVAVALALGYLLLAVRQNAWCWACAAASSAIYFVLFARGGLVMQAALQVFYAGMAAYGWRSWRGGARQAGGTLPVSRWSRARHAWAAGLVLAATLASGWAIAGRGGGPVVPYVDAFVAWVSVLATWMVARKILENWLYWIVVDSVAAALYWSQGFHATGLLFVLYVVIATRGFLTWRADLRRSTVPAGNARG